MRTSRILLAAAVVTTSVVTIAVVRASAGHPAVRRDRSAMSTAAGSTTTGALRVLRQWDRDRAAAWAHDDPVALRSLYVRGSTAGRRDVVMLSAYEHRGLRVRSMRRQVLAVHVRRSRPRLLTMVVTDRLVDGTVAGAGVRTALPVSRAATRRIELRRVGRRWRVAEVYAR